jgi:saccharopine dehydrogenase-like NADP-dependent oxidoreductase
VKIAVLGAGAMGQIAVQDLCRSVDVQEVLVADLSLERACALSAKLQSGKLKTACADVQSCQSLSAVLCDFDVVINCSPYVFNVAAMEAALASGCHYLDLGGLFHITRKQLELDEQFRKSDLLAVIGMGAAPGLTNVMAACAASELDTVEAVDICVAGVDLVSSSHPFLPPYALDTLLDEYSLNPVVFENGDFREVLPMSGVLSQEFPEPVGTASTFLTLHSEVATLPLSYRQKGIKRVTYRLGLPALFHERCSFLVQLGFAGKQVLNIDGLEVRPRRILAQMIENLPVPCAEPDDCEVIRVDVSGTKDGCSRSCRLEALVRAKKEWSISAGAFDTGTPPSIVAQLICREQIRARGVQAPETCVPWRDLFDELSSRGILVRRLS